MYTTINRLISNKQKPDYRKDRNQLKRMNLQSVIIITCREEIEERKGGGVMIMVQNGVKIMKGKCRRGSTVSVMVKRK